MKLARIRKDQSGKIPIPLIIVFVVIIGGGIFAFLAFSGVVNIPGITPEEEKEPPKENIEITEEQHIANTIKTLTRTNSDQLEDIAELEEKVELKDERIESLQAEVARLEGLVELSDKNAVKDMAITFEVMSPEYAEEILAKYDPEKAVLLLKAMEQKNAAAIIELMDTDAAAQITQMMAGLIQPFDVPGGETPEPVAPPAATVPGPSATGGG